MNSKTLSLILVAAAILAGLALTFFAKPQPPVKKQIKIPAQLSEAAIAGKGYFEAKNCVRCHGKNAAGTNQGPPLIHKIYESGHHSDATFYRAVEKGVKAHHWPFGNMPPQLNVRVEEVTAIIKYIRELQRENGIL